MSAAPNLCEKPCETCVKEGLPILLARYAVMPTESKAPRLGGSLMSPELNGMPLGPGAHYGLRLLRAGYVMVFDEARNHWEEYFVTVDGYLAKMPPRVRALIARAKPATEFACARNGVAPMAGLITIRNPKHATKVWFGFSDVEWTDSVFEKHRDASYREQHMQCVTISDGKVSAQPRTAPLAELDKWLPEFAMQPIPAVESFSRWNPHVFNPRKEQTSSLLSAAQKARPEGGAAIVALHDPVSVATELASLMELRKQVFINHPSVVRPRMAASTIASLEFSLKEQAKLDEVLAGEEIARSIEEGPGAYNPNPALWGTTGDPELAEKFRTHSPERLQQIADRKWREYTHTRQDKQRFDHAASKAWMQQYDKEFKAFDAAQIAPLAKAYVAWMKHRCMANHMNCNYDAANLGSGLAFTTVIGKCLRHTADKQPCQDLYLEWLKDGKAAGGNLVMRALSFNQDQLAAKINEIDRAELEIRAFPTDAVVGVFKESLVKLLPMGAQAALGAVLDGVSGAALRYWSDFNDGKAGPRAAAALAAVSGRQMVRLPVVGRRDKFIQAFTTEVFKLDPNLRANHNQLGKAVAAQVKLMGIEGLQMGTSDKRVWYVLLDQQIVKAASAQGLTGDALARKVALAIRSPDDLYKLDVARWKLRIDGAGVNLAAGIVGGLLQAFNFTKLYDDYASAMSHERTETMGRLATGVLAIVGTVSEAVGNGLEKAGEARLRNAAGLSRTIVPELFKTWGRRLGLGVGLVVGVMDLMKMNEEKAKGDTGLASLYFWSGGLGIGVATAMFFANFLGPIGWAIVVVALIALFIVTALIEKKKDNKIQEWLARCHFGRGPEKYADQETEQKELQLAFAE
jgi:hypothetical protein